jgi:hypothetical protein
MVKRQKKQRKSADRFTLEFDTKKNAHYSFMESKLSSFRKGLKIDTKKLKFQTTY